MVERVCRIGAIVIAVLAVIDPAWVSARAVPPRVVVRNAGDAAGPELAHVRDVLSGSFVIDDEESPDTAVRVLVGRQVPSRPSGAPTFVVVPAASADAPDIVAIRVGESVSLDAVARVAVDIVVPAGAPAAARQLRTVLSADGVPVDVRTIAVEPGAGRVTADLRFVPSRHGLARLRVSAQLGSGPEALADATTEVVNRKLRVLVYEARPSWSATFVRRALEEDPRLEVVVRSMTSRGVAADAGAPPATLERPAELSAFDLVMVASPGAMGDHAGAALEAYLRDREGAVVLLPDAGNGPVLSRLTGVPVWNTERRPALTGVGAPAGAWTASEFLWPATWPAGAEAMTDCLPSTGASRRCAVWRVPVGGGRVIVSSAIDGWRTRAAEASGFASFWRALVGGEAAATPRPVEVSLRSRLVESGSQISAEVRVADRATAPRGEWQSTEGAVVPVRLWPAGEGRYRIGFRAPDAPGRYRLVVSDAAAEFLVVDPGTVHRPTPEGIERLTAYATSRGGEVITIADLDGLPNRLASAVGAAPVDMTIRPMRSPWWIVPFAGLLTVEWWSRRRRGVR